MAQPQRHTVAAAVWLLLLQVSCTIGVAVASSSTLLAAVALPLSTLPQLTTHLPVSPQMTLSPSVQQQPRPAEQRSRHMVPPLI